MSTAVETPTGAPAASATETPVRDWSSLSTELETPEVSPSEKKEEPKTSAETGKPAEAATPEKKEGGAVTEAATPADEALQRLDEFIKADEKPAAVETPTQPVSHASTPEAQQLATWSQNPEFAKEAVSATIKFFNLDQAAQAGDVPGVLNQFAPQFQEALLEHLYQQNKQKFVERFIAENEGRPAPVADPRVAQMERQLAETRDYIARQQQQAQQWQQQQAIQQRNQAFTDHWNKLFSTVNVTDAEDKDALIGSTMLAISRDPKAAKNVADGRYGDINKIFRQKFEALQKRKQAIDAKDTAVRDQQEQKKSGQLPTSTAVSEAAAAPPTDQDFDSEGNRTQSFWEKSLKSIGLK